MVDWSHNTTPSISHKQTLTRIIARTSRHTSKTKMPTLTKLYTMEEASQHNTNEDCWVVIDGKVYDVSTYLDDHPGGDDVLVRAAGKDATEEFEDAGHSKTAREEMEQFFIGEVEDLPPPIQEMEIVYKKQQLGDLHQKILNFSKQYWVAPVAAVGLSVTVGLLFLRKKQNI